MLVKNKTTDDSWFFRFYEDGEGKRVHRNQRIGTIREYPRRRDAEKAVLSLRAKINSGVRSPETVNDLVTHYSKHELTLARKAFATVDAHNQNNPSAPSPAPSRSGGGSLFLAQFSKISKTSCSLRALSVSSTECGAISIATPLQPTKVPKKCGERGASDSFLAVAMPG